MSFSLRITIDGNGSAPLYVLQLKSLQSAHVNMFIKIFCCTWHKNAGCDGDVDCHSQKWILLYQRRIYVTIFQARKVLWNYNLINYRSGASRHYIFAHAEGPVWQGIRKYDFANFFVVLRWGYDSEQSKAPFQVNLSTPHPSGLGRSFCSKLLYMLQDFITAQLQDMTSNMHTYVHGPLWPSPFMCIHLHYYYHKRCLLRWAQELMELVLLNSCSLLIWPCTSNCFSCASELALPWLSMALSAACGSKVFFLASWKKVSSSEYLTH